MHTNINVITVKSGEGGGGGGIWHFFQSSVGGVDGATDGTIIQVSSHKILWTVVL